MKTTLQSIHDATDKLRHEVCGEAFAMNRVDPPMHIDLCFDKAEAKRRHLFAPLQEQCGVLSGHIYSGPHCIVCAHDKSMAKKVLARNLSVG